MYFTGSYFTEGGIFKAELILNEHMPPPPDHVFYNARDVGIGVTGSYEGDEAELTGTALVGKRSLSRNPAEAGGARRQVASLTNPHGSRRWLPSNETTAKAEKPRKTAAGQKEMLMWAEGKKLAAKKVAKPERSTGKRKAGYRSTRVVPLPTKVGSCTYACKRTRDQPSCNRSQIAVPSQRRLGTRSQPSFGDRPALSPRRAWRPVDRRRNTRCGAG